MRLYQYLFFIMFLYGASLISAIDGQDDSNENEDCDDDDDEDQKPAKIEDFVGTNLFGDDGCVKKCFSTEDVALLAARKEFECLIPKELDKCLLNDQSVETLMQYFYGANQIILKMTEGNAKMYSQKAFYDTLGGYLNYFMIPVTKMSYYAGVITLKTTLHVFELLQQCKIYLNTNGNGWRPALIDFTDFELGIEPLTIGTKSDETEETEKTACINLNLADERSENDEDMIVSLPKLDPEEHEQLSNIWLPFKRKHSFNLRSSLSAFILMRYYVSVSKCYHVQGVCQDTFNHRFKDWLQKNIEPHLNDDILYPGLGAVLRILESLQRRKKSIFSSEPVEKSGKSSRRDSANPKKTSEFVKISVKANKLSNEPKESKGGFFQNFFHIGRGVSSKEDDEATPDDEDEEEYEDSDDKEPISKQKDYLMGIILILLILLLFIFLICMIMKYMRDICKCDGGEAKKKKREEAGKNTEFKIPRKKRGLCAFMTERCCRKRPISNQDEEIALKSDSSSIMSSNKSVQRKAGVTDHKSTTSCSVTDDTPPRRTGCLPLCLRKKLKRPKPTETGCPKTKRRWFCVSCSKQIHDDDPIFSKDPNCPKEKRKCFNCSRRQKKDQFSSESPDTSPPKTPRLPLKKFLSPKQADHSKGPTKFTISKIPKKQNLSEKRLEGGRQQTFICNMRPRRPNQIMCARQCEGEGPRILSRRSNSFDATKFIIPKDLEKCLLNDEAVETLMQYFYGANQIVLKMTDGNAKMYAQKAFYDALGGYLNCYMVPLTKLSFYGGVMTLKTTQHVFELLQQCKIYLNTNGNGWRPPLAEFGDFELNIEPLTIFSKSDEVGEENEKTACLNLNLADERSENDEDMIVSLPKSDPEEFGQLSNIWLPFKRKHSFNLRSHLSAFILIRYFVSVSKCYTFQGVCQDTFNHRFKDWLQENIEPHLNDDVLYPGLGAVLRILETIQHKSKTTKTIEPIMKSEKSIKTSRDSLKSKKTQQHLAKIKPKAACEAKSKQNFFQKFFAKDDEEDDEDIDESLAEYRDNNDSVRYKRRNYIIAAIVVAIVLLIFICLVAIITRNMREMCKGDSKKKKLEKQRKREEKAAEKAEKDRGRAGFCSFLSAKRKKNTDEDEEKVTGAQSSSSASAKEKVVGMKRYKAFLEEKFDRCPKNETIPLSPCEEKEKQELKIDLTIPECVEKALIKPTPPPKQTSKQQRDCYKSCNEPILEKDGRTRGGTCHEKENPQVKIDLTIPECVEKALIKSIPPPKQKPKQPDCCKTCNEPMPEMKGRTRGGTCQRCASKKKELPLCKSIHQMPKICPQKPASIRHVSLRITPKRPCPVKFSILKKDKPLTVGKCDTNNPPQSPQKCNTSQSKNPQKCSPPKPKLECRPKSEAICFPLCRGKKKKQIEMDLTIPDDVEKPLVEQKPPPKPDCCKCCGQPIKESKGRARGGACLSCLSKKKESTSCESLHEFAEKFTAPIRTCRHVSPRSRARRPCPPQFSISKKDKRLKSGECSTASPPKSPPPKIKWELKCKMPSPPKPCQRKRTQCYEKKVTPCSSPPKPYERKRTSSDKKVTPCSSPKKEKRCSIGSASSWETVDNVK